MVPEATEIHWCQRSTKHSSYIVVNFSLQNSRKAPYSSSVRVRYWLPIVSEKANRSFTILTVGLRTLSCCIWQRYIESLKYLVQIKIWIGTGTLLWRVLFTANSKRPKWLVYGILVLTDWNSIIDPVAQIRELIPVKINLDNCGDPFDFQWGFGKYPG